MELPRVADDPSESPPCRPAAGAPRARRARLVTLALLLGGVLLGQLVFFAPSLSGARLLLPLDVLALERVYLPAQAGGGATRVHDVALADQVLQYVFDRELAARELRAGRLPTWNPGAFCGAPAAVWCAYSPFNLPYDLVPRPQTLAWIQLCVALVAALGAYLFLREVLGLGRLAALCGAWALPLTGFFQLWVGYPLGYVAAWLPWVLWLVERTLRGEPWWSAPALGVLAGVAVLSGVVTVAAHLLLAAAVFALGRALVVHASWGQRLRALARVLLALALGLALAAFWLLPMLDYARQGARMALRAAGVEERPPIGWPALLQLLVPDALGSTREGGMAFGAPNQMESAAGAWIGLVSVLVLAPLAFLRRERRALASLLALLFVLAFAWVVDLPGVVSVLRLPVLEMLANNRFVFVAGFALLALAACGLDALLAGARPPRAAAAVGALLALALCAWLLAGASELPAFLARALAARAAAAGPELPATSATAELGAPLRAAFREGAAWSACAAVLWLALALAPRARLPRVARATALVASLVVPAELVRFGLGLAPQCDPALYYPRLAVLEALAKAPPGRVLPIFCLPARLLESHGLRDVRGYDAVDPARYLALLARAESDVRDSPPYARTQAYVPAMLPGEGAAPRLPPILSLLGVRYLVLEGEPPPGAEPFAHAQGYWVHENREALPRAFVPARVEWLEGEPALARMGAADFDPRALAFVEEPLSLAAPARGQARVVAEHPTRVELELALETPSLVVLADRWDAGWSAELDGEAVDVLRVDHELRGVLAPAGARRLVYRYRPRTLVAGAALGGLAVLVLAGWGLRARRSRAR